MFERVGTFAAQTITKKPEHLETEILELDFFIVAVINKPLSTINGIVIHRVSVLDFEDCSLAIDSEKILEVSKTLISLEWRNPLFVGIAGGASELLAKLGCQVVALHCPDHAKYLREYEKREINRGRTKQRDYWGHHEDLFKHRMPKLGIVPFVIDTMSDELIDRPDLVTITIRERFKLRATGKRE
jgi:hypothetical protein